LEQVLRILVGHGYVILFAAVFLDQLTVWLPSPPVVIAMGFLARANQYDFCSALAVATIAASMADTAWYAAGRWSALAILNRIEDHDHMAKFLNPQASMRNLTRALLGVKFNPVPTLFVPLWAGARCISLRSFVFLDTLINVLWALSFLVIGYTLEREISAINGYFAWASCASLIGVSYLPRLWSHWKRRQSPTGLGAGRQIASRQGENPHSLGPACLTMLLRGAVRKSKRFRVRKDDSANQKSSGG
jgi:membrane protein DedA with SNARE-associated domain